MLDVSNHHAGDGLLEVLPALLAGPKAPACLLLHENQLTVTGLEQLARLMSAAETHPTEVLVVTHEDAHFALTHEVEKLKRPWESVAKRVQSATVQIQQAVAVGRARRRLYPRMRHPRPIGGVPYVMRWPNWAELLHQAAPGSPAGTGMQSWDPPPTPLSEYGNSPTPRDGVDEDEAEGVHDPAFEAALADPFGGLDFDFAPAAPGIPATPPPPPPPPPDLMGDLMGMDVSGFGSPAMGITSSGFCASDGSSFTPSFDGNGFGTSIAFTPSFDGNGFGTSFGGNVLGATPTPGSSSFMDSNAPVFSGGFSSGGGNGSFDTSQGFDISFADAQGFSGGLGEANFAASNGFGVTFGGSSHSSAVAESTSTEQVRSPLSPQATTNVELPAGESGVDDEDDFTNFGSPGAVVNSAQAPAPAPEFSAPAPAPAMGVAAGAIDADLFTMAPDPPAPAPAPAPAMIVAAGAIDADLFTMATQTQATDGGMLPISGAAAFGSGGFGAGFDTPAGFDSSFSSPAHPEAGAPTGFGASFDAPVGFESSFSSPAQPDASATTGFGASFDTPARFAASFSSPAEGEAGVIASFGEGFGASFEAAGKSGAGEHNESSQLSKRFSTSFDPAGDTGSFGASFSDAPAFSGNGVGANFSDGAVAVATEAAAVGFEGRSGFSDAPAFGSSGGSFSNAPAFFSSGFGPEATKAVDGAPSNVSPNQVSFASETQETTAPSTPPNHLKPKLKTGFSAFSMDGDDDFGMDGDDGMEGDFVSVTPGQSPLGTFAFSGSTSFDHETPLSGGGAGEAFSSAFSSAFLDDPFDESDESTATEPAAAEVTPAESVEAASVASAPAAVPSAEESAASESALPEPVAEEPAAEEPAAEEPVAVEPPAESLAAEEPVVPPSVEPAAEESAPAVPAEQGAAHESAAAEPVADESVAEQLAAAEPAAEEPSAEEPVAEEPSADAEAAKASAEAAELAAAEAEAAKAEAEAAELAAAEAEASKAEAEAAELAAAEAEASKAEAEAAELAAAEAEASKAEAEAAELAAAEAEASKAEAEAAELAAAEAEAAKAEAEAAELAAAEAEASKASAEAAELAAAEAEASKAEAEAAELAAAEAEASKAEAEAAELAAAEVAVEVHLSASLKKLCDASAADISTLYAVQDLLGEGRFSKVYSAVNEATGQVLALKELDMGAIEEDEEGIEMLEAEVLALKRACNAPHIVRLLKVVASPAAIYLAMVRVPGRELFMVLEERGALQTSFVRHLMQQLLMALTALAEVGVVHRDVKPENMMVSGEETERPHLTLIDFGYAALLGGGDAPTELTGVAGSPEYAAPEVLSWIAVEAGDAGEEEGEPYDAGCDVWSVGVTAHVLLCADLPFDLPEEVTEESLVAAALNVDLSFRRLEGEAMVRQGDDGARKIEGEATMAPAREFVRTCMTVDRHERPSALQLLEHPWFGVAATTTAEEGVRVDEAGEAGEAGEAASGSASGQPEEQAGAGADAPEADSEEPPPAAAEPALAESTATEPAAAEVTPAEPAEAASVANAPASSATIGDSSPFGKAAAASGFGTSFETPPEAAALPPASGFGASFETTAAFPPASGFGASFETPPEAAAFPPASGFGASFETPPEAAAFPPASGFGASFGTAAAFPPASDFAAGGFGDASFASAHEPK